jgi:hypothetical protein
MSTASVDRRTLNEAYQQAERAQCAANDAVRKAEQMLREARTTQHQAALTVSTLVLIMQELP